MRSQNKASIFQRLCAVGGNACDHCMRPLRADHRFSKHSVMFLSSRVAVSVESPCSSSKGAQFGGARSEFEVSPSASYRFLVPLFDGP
jgi:hypothetical protein